jgi:IS5 family transposase
MTTSKSPVAVAYTAYEAGKKVLPNWRHEFSPKKFTQPQLFACLVLKSFFNTDYRGIVAILSEHIAIRKILNLEHIPHYTTLQKASKNILKSKTVKRLMSSLMKIYLEETKEKRSIALFDSTGFDTEHASSYFKWRKDSGSKDKPPRWYKKYPKLSISTLPRSMLITSGFITMGPSTDMPYFERLLKQTLNSFQPKIIIADAGYDKELNHIIAKEKNIKTIIPCRAYRGNRVPKAPNRRNMHEHFPKKHYGIRWHVETVMSMLKRNFGAKVFGKTFRSQSRELMLKILTHNTAIVPM